MIAPSLVPSIRNRPGIQRLLRAARDRDFEVVIAESTSRISRDQEDRAALRKALRFAGIELMTPVDGVVTDFVDGVRSVIDSQVLEDQKHAIRRGMEGLVREGLSVGGLTYGYAAVPGQPGQLVIVEAEAEVVRRIYSAIASGATPRDVAYALNHDGVPAPRGSRWNASTINGNAARGSGILNNRLYIGERVWNRSQMLRNPETARRVSRSNPETAWKTKTVPHLAIVPRELWDIRADARPLRDLFGVTGGMPAGWAGILCPLAGKRHLGLF